jgi:methionine-rich copper-binding protein CopC
MKFLRVHLTPPQIRPMGILTLGLAGLVMVSAAWGHALLVDSIPRSGETLPVVAEIVLRFNNRIEKDLSRVTLQGPRASEVRLERADSPSGPDILAYRVPALPSGSYRATWKVLSTDGHLTEGILVFQVAGPPGGR